MNGMEALTNFLCNLGTPIVNPSLSLVLGLICEVGLYVGRTNSQWDAYLKVGWSTGFYGIGNFFFLLWRQKSIPRITVGEVHALLNYQNRKNSYLYGTEKLWLKIPLF